MGVSSLMMGISRSGGSSFGSTAKSPIEGIANITVPLLAQRHIASDNPLRHVSSHPFGKLIDN